MTRQLSRIRYNEVDISIIRQPIRRGYCEDKKKTYCTVGYKKNRHEKLETILLT